MKEALPGNSYNPAPFDQNSPRSFYWLWGLMFGPIIFFWQATEFRTQNASLHWPTVAGTVIECSHTGYIGYRGSTYSAHIVFRYEINGTQYESYQISLWSPNLNSWARPREARRFVNSHPVGSEVTVYYDPKQFGNAVLIPGAYGQLNLLGMIVGALMVFVAVLSIINGIKRRRMLQTLLNAPDAQTRTIRIRRGDIEKGRNGYLLNFFIALGFLIPAGGLFAGSLLRSAAIFPDPSAPAWPLIAGAVPFILGFVFFVMRAARQSRSAECPFCRNTLNKASVKNARCSNCGTPIAFQHIPA